MPADDGDSRDPEMISPTRRAEGVTTAPLVTAEAEILSLRAEIARLQVQL
jgi:hypothetical protein